MADKLWGALGLCQKAGALTVGFDAVAEALEKGEAQMLLFAADVSAKTKERMLRRNERQIPAHMLPYSQQDLARIAHKSVGVLAVINPDLAALCAKSMIQPNKEEPV